MKQYTIYILWLLIIVAQISYQMKFEGEIELGSNNKIENQNDIKADSFYLENLGDQKNFISEEIAPSKITFNPDLIMQSGEKLNPVLSDWLEISSPQFKNQKKFPSLENPSGEMLKIKTDDAYFRINKYYNKNDKNGPPTNLFFWFRLSGRNLYYSMKKDEMNVLGSLYIKDINEVTPMKGWGDQPNCFVVLDNQKDEWKLCAENLTKKAKWTCTIKSNIGKKDKDCEKMILAEGEITVLSKKVTQPIILIPQAQRLCNEDWNYNRNGDDWECGCKEGKEQSPIDLPNKEKSKLSPVKPLFKYEEIAAQGTFIRANGEVQTDQILKMVLNNGSLRIKYSNFGKIITLDGSIFVAEEIVFHTPAQHKINGKSFDMEMEIIHRGETKGDIAKQAVLSFLFEKKPGVYNKLLDDMDFFNLPSPNRKEKDLVNNIYIPKILYNSDSGDLAVMKPFSFYTYQGSLTVPPCSERTIHYVAANPIPIGNVVIQLFSEATRMPDMMDANGNIIVNSNKSANNRSVQPLNGRNVYYYDHIKMSGPDPPQKPKPKPIGHYEKLTKKIKEYFYVNSDKPSELPGAYVVTEEEAKGR